MSIKIKNSFYSSNFEKKKWNIQKKLLLKKPRKSDNNLINIDYKICPIMFFFKSKWKSDSKL